MSITEPQTKPKPYPQPQPDLPVWIGDCQFPEPDSTPSEMLGWTTDLCPKAAYALAKHPDTGRWVFVSTRPIRAMAPDAVYDNVEPCKQHVGRLAKCPDGRWRVVYCSRSSGETEYHMASFARAPAGNAVGATAGRWVGVGCYRAPWWTEAIMHSELKLCGVGPD